MVNLRNRSEFSDCTHLVDRVRWSKQQPDFYQRELKSDHVEILTEAFQERDDISIFKLVECILPENGLLNLLAALKRQRLTHLQLSGHAYEDAEFSAILQMIEEQKTLTYLDFSNNNLTEDQQCQLIDTLQRHPSLKTLRLDKGTLNDKGAAALGGALPTMGITQLYLTKNMHIAQKGMTAILEGVAQSHSLELINLSHTHLKNHHGEQVLSILKDQASPLYDIDLTGCGLHNADQVTEMALATLRKPNMVRLCTGKVDLTDQHNRLLDSAARNSRHKNLRTLNIGNKSVSIALKQICRDNANTALKLADELDLVWRKRADATVSMLAEFHSRLPLMQTTQAGRIHVFLPFLESLPGLENIEHADDVLRTNEAGFTPLDNPANWQQFPALAAELAAQGTPVTSTHLMTPNKDGNPSLCSALHAPQFPAMLARLNQSGIQFTGGDLVNEQGKPSTLASYAHQHGHLAAFFTQENWRGRHPAELAYVYRHLPEDLQNAIPNFFGLQTELQREARMQQGEERSA